MTVSQFGSKPNQVLLSGLRSADPYYQVRTRNQYLQRNKPTLEMLTPRAQQFAFIELSTLTLRDASRRQAIYKDVKPGSATGGAWEEISRECLLLLGTELQRVKGRGRLPGRPS